jgi:hypothetical protein
MAISGRHEPLPRLAPYAAATTPNPTCLTLQIADSSGNRLLVRLDKRPSKNRIADRETAR